MSDRADLSKFTIDEIIDELARRSGGRTQRRRKAARKGMRTRARLARSRQQRTRSTT